MKITGKYEATINPVVSGTTFAETLVVTAKDVKYSQALNGQLDAMKAKKMELVSPTMEKCKDFFTDAVLMNLGGKLQFQKTLVGKIDDDNRRACSLLLFAIKSSGMHLRLSDVPVVNGGRGTVSTVDIVLE